MNAKLTGISIDRNVRAAILKEALAQGKTMRQVVEEKLGYSVKTTGYRGPRINDRKGHALPSNLDYRKGHASPMSVVNATSPKNKATQRIELVIKVEPAQG